MKCLAQRMRAPLEKYPLRSFVWNSGTPMIPKSVFNFDFYEIQIGFFYVTTFSILFNKIPSRFFLFVEDCQAQKLSFESEAC